jgi:N-hydroxyarylamine O-acetyltransferase
MYSRSNQLGPELVEQILRKLGFSAPPSVDISGLTSLYRAWCRRVPFDNIRKRIHLATDNPLPLPGHDDEDFFQGWLRFGTGGLCWAGNAALHALLGALGFSCNLGTATMLTDEDQPPNHGTVTVQLENKMILVDASLLHDVPLLLDPEQISSIDQQAWGLTCSPHGPKWLIRWRPLHMPDGCRCRTEQLSVSRDSFRQLNEVTRKQSPFNNSLYMRLNSGESVLGISDGMSVQFTASGEITTTPLSREGRVNYLVEKMGIEEEIINQIPPD